jgi:transposase
MSKEKQASPPQSVQPEPGQTSRAGNQHLRSFTVGALPIINHILRRTRLEEFLQEALPSEDPRRRLPTATGLLVLLRNLLVSREPLYGVGEWATHYVPELLGLTPEQLPLLNDDRLGRDADRLFASDLRGLVLSVATFVCRQFDVRLDQLHNDSTTISFFGTYALAAEEKSENGHRTLAITWGHSKARRPDLKQLLFELTVSNDGGVPVFFTPHSGNVTDDQTHRETWQLLCRLVGRKDFLYVADCKLATMDNMTFIDQEHGRFISVLPRSRKEDGEFRERVRRQEIAWTPLCEKKDPKDQVLDRYSICDEPAMTREGFRLWWFHSTRKAELDATARSESLERALRRLGDLRERLRSPRTRLRQPAKVQEAVEKILDSSDCERWLRVQVEEKAVERYHQATPGRPGKNTRYVKATSTRLDLTWDIDEQARAEEHLTDGIFPLVTNAADLSAQQVLDAYKGQPVIEKRFSQLKTDFLVAPVYLKSVRRIQALLALYFFTLLVEALLERELRKAMRREGVRSLPLYPEGRECRRPTARRVLDLFENVQRHTLVDEDGQETVFWTELSPVQRKVLDLLGVPAADYGQ